MDVFKKSMLTTENSPLKTQETAEISMENMTPNEKIKQMVNDPVLMQRLEDKFMRKKKIPGQEKKTNKNYKAK